MSRIFAIGDIHGCSRTFQKLVAEGIRPTRADHIYCIGDYIDRGPDSKGVIDEILRLRREGFHIHTLRGNHEQLMLEARGNPDKNHHWLANGGDKTLESFGIGNVEELDPVYQVFLKSTRYYFKTPEYIFVHAGLNFDEENPLEDRDAMLWMRSFSVDPERIGRRTIIHGHTPQPVQVITHPPKDGVINIDAGCVYKHREGCGYLAAINLTDGEWILIKNQDDY